MTTRACRAKELAERLERGPSWGMNFVGLGLTKEQELAITAKCENLTRIWLSTWITPVVSDLVPELRKRA